MENVKAHFEEEASDFDRIILNLVPDYQGMIEALVAILPFDRAQAIRVIDLGCGTGTVARRVLDVFPNAYVTCLDLAANMIAMAKAKLSGFAQVAYRVGDFSIFEGQYDAIVSSLALHHLENREDKQRFYQRAFDRLAPGGVFYNADIVLGASAALQDTYMREWRAFMRRHTPAGEIEEKWIPKYQVEDHPEPLVEQLAWMAQAGFTEIDVIWKRYNFGVYGGKRR